MAQAGAVAQAVKTRACARGRVRLWTLVAAAVAKAAITQGSCVVCAQLVQAAMEAQSCRALAVAVTAAAETKKLRATMAAEAGRGNERCENKTPPSPPLIRPRGVAEGSTTAFFAILVNLAMRASLKLKF